MIKNCLAATLVLIAAAALAEVPTKAQRIIFTRQTPNVRKIDLQTGDQVIFKLIAPTEAIDLRHLDATVHCKRKVGEKCHKKFVILKECDPKYENHDEPREWTGRGTIYKEIKLHFAWIAARPAAGAVPVPLEPGSDALSFIAPEAGRILAKDITVVPAELDPRMQKHEVTAAEKAQLAGDPSGICSAKGSELHDDKTEYKFQIVQIESVTYELRIFRRDS